MNPIKIENIDNIADIYILRRKMNKSLLYIIICGLLNFIPRLSFDLITSMNIEAKIIIVNIYNSVYAGLLANILSILFTIAIILWAILSIIVTLKAMNKAIDFFTTSNEQHYLKKSKFQKNIYIFQFFLSISLNLPFISNYQILVVLICILIAIINLRAWGAIKEKLKVIESEFFKKVSK